MLQMCCRGLIYWSVPLISGTTYNVVILADVLLLFKCHWLPVFLTFTTDLLNGDRTTTIREIWEVNCIELLRVARCL